MTKIYLALEDDNFMLYFDVCKGKAATMEEFRRKDYIRRTNLLKEFDFGQMGHLPFKFGG